ncbi:MAG: hypothetical protein EXR62_05850 [Chloroflexi bacterium]|nr:hypothetical protein [Chloroflexota bacterium]
MARYPQSVLISCEVPWDENYKLMEGVFRKEIRLMLKYGFQHLYIFGTAGEGYAVDTPRFREIVQLFWEETRGEHIHPMVGIIGLSTANVIERMSFAYEVGFKVFQISLPSWGVLNDTEMMTFFKDVCGTFQDCQFLHYNLVRTKRVLNGTDYRRLVDAIPNLVATKNTGGGMPGTADLILNSPELQHFLGEENFPYGCMLGECSLLATKGPTAPHKTFEFFEAGVTRQIEKLYRMHADYQRFSMDIIGPLRGQGAMDGAYDKLGKRLGGLEEMPLRLLSPYQSFTEEQYQHAKRTFHEKYPDWVPAKVNL